MTWVGGNADSQCVAVVTVGGDDVIPFLTCPDGANGNGFLPNIEVEKPFDFTF